MKISTRTLLAAALLVALPTSGAMACTISNWNGTNTAAAANTGGPAEGIARYSGVCGLAVDSGKYVVDNTPGTEGTYRARFYVLTKATGGTVTIFRAGSGDNGASPVIEVDYTGSAFNFRQNGTAVGAGVTGIQADRWYSIELFYKANTGFNATVGGAGSDAVVGTVSSATAGAGTIGSAVLGAVSGSTGSASLGFDAFESTRSETTPIGRLCRGDANNSSTISSADASAIITEYLGGALASGQPDANESGGVTAADASVVMNLFLNGVSCS